MTRKEIKARQAEVEKKRTEMDDLNRQAAKLKLEIEAMEKDLMAADPKICYHHEKRIDPGSGCMYCMKCDEYLGLAH